MSFKIWTFLINYTLDIFCVIWYIKVFLIIYEWRENIAFILKKMWIQQKVYRFLRLLFGLYKKNCFNVFIFEIQDILSKFTFSLIFVNTDFFYSSENCEYININVVLRYHRTHTIFFLYLYVLVNELVIFAHLCYQAFRTFYIASFLLYLILCFI